MTKRLISKAELAKRAGVSRAAVTKVCKGKVNKAVVDGKVDLDHPSVVEYLKSKATSKTEVITKEPISSKSTNSKKTKIKPSNTNSVTSQNKPKVDSNKKYDPKDNALNEVLHLTLMELVKEFGTDWQFEGWVNGVKKITDIRYKNLQLAELEGSLISRELVVKVIFGAMENSNKRLLVDVPKTMARQLMAMGKAGEPIEDGEAAVRKVLSIQLKNVTTTAQRVLEYGTAKP